VPGDISGKRSTLEAQLPDQQARPLREAVMAGAADDER
jgi:hypothetical protein